MKVYAVKLGGKLWVDSKFYFFSKSATKNLLNAHFFQDYKEAEKVAKMTSGKVKEINIIEGDEEETEVDLLRASIIQLQKERDAALNQLNLYKLNNKEVEEDENNFNN